MWDWVLVDHENEQDLEEEDVEEVEEEEWKKTRRKRQRRRRRATNQRTGASERRRQLWAWGQNAERMWAVLCWEGWVGVEWEMCEWEVERRREARWMQEARDRRQWLSQARWLEELWRVAVGGPIWKASVEEADGWEIVDGIGRKNPFRVEPDGWEIVDGWHGH